MYVDTNVGKILVSIRPVRYKKLWPSSSPFPQSEDKDTVSRNVHLITNFLYFGRSMQSPCRVCARVYVRQCPSVNFSITEPVFMKRGMCIMATEPISMEHFINPFHQFVSLCVPLSVLGNGQVKSLPLEGLQTQQFHNFCGRRFLCSPCSIKGKQERIFSRISFIFIFSILLYRYCDDGYCSSQQIGSSGNYSDL